MGVLSKDYCGQVSQLQVVTTLQETVQVACNNCVLSTGWLNGIGVKNEELNSVDILVLQ